VPDSSPDGDWALMERWAYWLKQHAPVLFRWVDKAARGVVRWRFGNRIVAAERQASMAGTINGQAASIRALTEDDLVALHGFLDRLPEARFDFFRPHGFSREALSKVLRSRALMCYGVFVHDRLMGYALLKVAPTGSAFIGLLIHPDLSGRGLGQFIVAFLYWQASLARLRTRSTISRDNPASLKSHQAVSAYQVVAELPNNYIMIEFPTTQRDKPQWPLT
jgi:GNAT superfamily N-acetyltransferase